jgi:hypothetical protein
MKYISRIFLKNWKKDIYRFDVDGDDYYDLYEEEDKSNLEDYVKALLYTYIFIKDTKTNKVETVSFNQFTNADDFCNYFISNKIHGFCRFGMEDIFYALSDSVIALKQNLTFIEDIKDTKKFPKELLKCSQFDNNEEEYIIDMPNAMDYDSSAKQYICALFRGGDYNTLITGESAENDASTPEGMILWLLNEYSSSYSHNVSAFKNFLEHYLDSENLFLEGKYAGYDIPDSIDYFGFSCLYTSPNMNGIHLLSKDDDCEEVKSYIDCYMNGVEYYRLHHDAFYQCIDTPLYISKDGDLYLGYSKDECFEFHGCLHYKVKDLNKLNLLVTKNKVLNTKPEPKIIDTPPVVNKQPKSQKTSGQSQQDIADAFRKLYSRK